MHYILLYTITMASGHIVFVEREAHTRNWRPVKSAVQCYRVAKDQQESLNISISYGNHPFKNIIVSCRKRGRK